MGDPLDCEIGNQDPALETSDNGFATSDNVANMQICDASNVLKSESASKIAVVVESCVPAQCSHGQASSALPGAAPQTPRTFPAWFDYKDAQSSDHSGVSYE